MVYIQRRETFSASHRLYNPSWTEEKNLDIFGKCSNKRGHGHNFQLIVTVKGIVNPETGFVMNLADLKSLILTNIIDHVDHMNLNEDVPFLDGIIPSTENLAMVFWEILSPLINNKGANLHCVRIIETENNSVEYFGK